VDKQDKIGFILYNIIYMDTLDLDINNYNINDIEKFFKLKPKSKYSESDIELKEYEIREQLLKSGHINKRFKTELIDFLNKAKQLLISVKCKDADAETKPTTIPKNYKLDKLDAPLSRENHSRTDELINRPERQFIYSNPSEFFPGSLNPLNTRVITKTLNIDTRFRDNLYATQSSDFTMSIPNKFNKVVSMQLSSIELPIVFYNISESFGNNYLYIQVNYNSFNFTTTGLTEEKFLIIPDGNYNSQGLIQTINKLLSPIDCCGNILYPDKILSYIRLSLDIDSNNSGTGKVSIKPIESHKQFINSITLDFSKNRNGITDTTSILTKIGWNLGFIKPKYEGCTFYIADTIFEMSTIRYIYLAIDDFNNNANNQFISIFNKSILNPNILARISIKGASFDSIKENNYSIITEPRQYFGPVDIQRLRIQIYDEYGRILNMNNSNYSFCLDFKLMYDL
jgi:hypothetical protein